MAWLEPRPFKTKTCIRDRLRRSHIATILNMGEAAEKDPRVYFAAERTFLAWIRTGLGLMGIGFAVSRFGLFLRELRVGAAHASPRSTGLSVWSGVALVALGVVVNVAASVHYVRLIRELRAGSWIPGRMSQNALTLALLLAGVGLAMAAYLIFVH